MEGGYCLRWSVWRILLHPRRALRALHEAEKGAADYTKRLNEALTLVEDLKMECGRLTNELGEVGRTYLKNKSSLEDTRRELADVRSKLDDQVSVERRLAEFDKMLAGVETMKRNYERRIRSLESRLRDEKKKSGRVNDDELLDSIDMGATHSLTAAPPRNNDKDASYRKARQPKLQARDEDGGGDSVNPGVQGPADIAPHIIEDSVFPDPDDPENKSQKKDADDWLISLPPDL